MPVQVRIEDQHIAGDGRIEFRLAIIVNGQEVAKDSYEVRDPQSLTTVQIREKIFDHVKAQKERYKVGQQAKSLVGQTIDVEP
jgi:hypothetical protein